MSNLIAAIIVALGAFVASFYQTSRMHRENRDDRNRQRLEAVYSLCDEIAEIVEETHTQLQGVRDNSLAYRKTAHEPIARLRKLIDLYFRKSLGGELKNLNRANGQWLAAIARCFDPGGQAEIAKLDEARLDQEEDGRNGIRSALKVMRQRVAEQVPG